MKFQAAIEIMPLKELLDPQGKAVGHTLKNIGLQAIQEVRIGKHIHFELEASNEAEAEQIVKKACDEILCNRVMEDYRFHISSLS